MPLGSAFMNPFPPIFASGNQFGGSKKKKPATKSYVDHPGMFLKPNGRPTGIQKGGSLAAPLPTEIFRKAYIRRLPKLQTKAQKGGAWRGPGPRPVDHPVKKPPKKEGKAEEKKAPKKKSLWEHAKEKLWQLHDKVKSYKLASRGLRLYHGYLKGKHAGFENARSQLDPKDKAHAHASHIASADRQKHMDNVNQYANWAEQLGYGKRKKKKMTGRGVLDFFKPPRVRMKGGSAFTDFFTKTIPSTAKKAWGGVKTGARYVYDKGLKPAYKYAKEKPVSTASYVTRGLSYIPSPFSAPLKAASAGLSTAAALTGKGKRKKKPMKGGSHRTPKSAPGQKIINF